MTVRSRVQQGGAADRRIPAALAVFLLLLLAVFLFLGRSNSSSESKTTTRQQAAPDKPSASSTPAAIQQASRPAAAESARTTPPTAVPTTEPQIEWKGRVLSEATGAPIAGALVEVLATDEGTEEEHWLQLLEETKKPRVVADCLTDSAGEWRLTTPAGREAAAGTFMYISAKGHASRLVCFFRDARRSPLVIVRLPKGGNVSGHVVDNTGRGIDGARIGGTGIQQTRARYYSDDLLQWSASWAVSGPEGAFLLEGVPSDASLRIPARKDGYVPGVSEEVHEGETDVRIVLRAGGGTINGRVFDADGMPSRNVRVSASPAREPGTATGQSLNQIVTATVDDAGAFALNNLAEGQWVVAANRIVPGNASAERTATTATLGEDETVTIEIRFRKPVIIRGHVTDIASNAGVPGVRVSNARQGGSSSPERIESITDGAGAFRLELPFNATIELYVTPPEGWTFSEKTKQASSGIFLSELSSGEERTVDIQLMRGAVLKGRVKSDEGIPVAHASIHAYDSALSQMYSATSDSGGLFTMTVAPGRKLSLSASTDAGHGEADVVIPDSEPPPEVTIVVHRFASISGTVKSSAGEPVSGIKMSSMRLVRGRPRVSSNLQDPTTDQQGAFLLRNLIPGTTVISLSVPDVIEDALPEPVILELAPGEDKKGVEIVLGAAESLEGIVRNEEGEPIPGASVNWSMAASVAVLSSSKSATRTDQLGHYRITGLGEKDVLNSITVSHPDYQTEERKGVSHLSGDQDFVLKRKRQVTLLAVDDASGDPITRYDYSLSMGTQPSGATWSGKPTRVENGAGKDTFLVEGSGKRRIDVVQVGDDGAPTGRKGAALFTPSADGAQEVVVRVYGGVTVSGKVIMEGSGEPVPGALVAVETEEDFLKRLGAPDRPGFGIPPATTDAQGAFVLTGFSDGSYPLVVTKAGLIPVDRPTVVVSREAPPVPLLITMSQTGSIRGNVIGPDGMPQFEAEVQGYSPGRTTTSPVLTDQRGNYRIPDLHRGSYEITVRTKESSMSARLSVDVVGGEEAVLNFDLSEAVILTGNIRINGEPWQVGEFRMRLEGKESTGFLRLTGVGSYTCRLTAGTKRLSVDCSDRDLGTFRFVDLPATPREQTMDFDITIVSADIVLDPAEGVDFTPGWIHLDRRVAGEDMPGGSRIDADAARRHLPRILPGEYRAFFSAKDGTLEGASDWTSITPGGENVIYVPVKKANR